MLIAYTHQLWRAGPRTNGTAVFRKAAITIALSTLVPPELGLLS